MPPLIGAIATAAIGAGVVAGVSLSTVVFAGLTVSHLIFASTLAYGAYQAHQARKDARRAYNRSLTDRNVTLLGADAPWQVIYGEATVAPTIVATLTSGTRDEFKHVVTVWAAHECDSCTDVLIGGVSLGALDGNGYVTSGKYYRTSTAAQFEGATFSAGGVATVSATIGTLLGISVDLGGDNGTEQLPLSAVSVVGNTITIEDKVTYAWWLSRAVTVAYTSSQSNALVRVRHFTGSVNQTADPVLTALLPTEWTATDRGRGLCYSVWTLNLNEPEFQAGPPQMTARWRGKKLYDPRTLTTAWSDNPALAVRDYLLAEYGKRCVAAQVDDASVAEAADDCDVTLAAFGSAKRFTCNGAFRTDQDSDRVLTQLCQSMAGFAVNSGVWTLHAGVWKPPVMALTDADNAGGVESIAAPTQLEVFNGLRGRFFDGDRFDQLTDYPPYRNTAFVAEDGAELWGDLDLPFTNADWRAHNIARIQVERSRGEQMVFPAKLRALEVQAGQRVTLTNSFLDFTDAAFRVVRREWQPGRPVMLHLQHDDETFYDEADAPASLTPASDNNPDPWVVAPPQNVQVYTGDTFAVYTTEGAPLSKVRITLDASTDELVVATGALIVEYRKPDDAAWTRAPLERGDATEVFLPALQDQKVYLLQLRYRNGIGALSDWTAAAVLVQADITPPETVAGLAASGVAGGALIKWTASQRVDYAYTELRIGGTWATGVPLSGGSAGSGTRIAGSEFVWLAPAQGSYTVRAKHVDISGNEGASDAAIALTIGADSLVTYESLSLTLGGGNLVWNSSFEADSNADSVPDYWGSTFFNGAVVSTTMPTDSLTHGTKCLRMEVTSVAGATGRTHLRYLDSSAYYAKVLPGEKIVMSGAFLANNSSYKGALAVRFYDGSFVQVGSEQVQEFTAPSAFTWWRAVGAPITVPATARFARMGVGIARPSTGDTTLSAMRFDAVQLEVGDVATAYAPRADEILVGVVGTDEMAGEAATETAEYTGGSWGRSNMS